jgi:Ca2+-transporting ATPase
MIMYVPFLQDAFGTSALSVAEWLALFGVAASVVPVVETAKWMERRGWFGEMD